MQPEAPRVWHEERPEPPPPPLDDPESVGASCPQCMKRLTDYRWCARCGWGCNVVEVGKP